MVHALNKMKKAGMPERVCIALNKSSYRDVRSNLISSTKPKSVGNEYLESKV